jgi:glycosyltransferase involved in cell wall biosynthesis
VVRCGIDLSARARGADSVRRELGLASTDCLVLGLFCLKPQKDPMTFVEVATRVLAQRANTVFVIAGDGELRDPLQARIDALGLTESVRLLGWRHDVPALLGAADLLLHTARWEGLPQVFPQAMAAGVPIVATAVDGAAEAIAHGETGWLCAPGDVTALARACTSMLQQPQLAREMGARATPRAQLFAQERMVASLESFYAELTERSSVVAG